MTKQYEILAAGECLVDFVRDANTAKIVLEGNPGGAPANVLAMAAKMGISTALVTKVGNDSFGDFLKNKVEEAGIDTFFVATDEAPTTLAIVSLDKSGNRSFSFYRNGTADVRLCIEDIPFETISSAGVFHFGSVSLTAEPSRTATLSAAKHAREQGVKVSFDPNLRPLLWDNPDEAKEQILRGLDLANLVKLSDEELFFLTGTDSIEEGIRILESRYSFDLLAVTCGPAGCVCQSGSLCLSGLTFDTDCIDTTGSGDAFWGACLGWLLENGKLDKTLSESELITLMDFCNAAGSLTATAMGAIPAMPNIDAIEECIRSVPRVIVPRG